MYVQSLLSDPLQGPEEREILMGGLRILVRRRSSDFFVLREVFKRKVYGPPPTGVVIDLGANIGAFSLYAAQKATRVYVFEPDPSNFTQLEKNCALNRSLPISAFKKAIGGSMRTGNLSLGVTNKGASSLVISRSRQSVPVEIITLDHALSLCGVSHVDFLKIDIEGSEFELFESCSLQTLRRISRIVMELHKVPGKRYRDIVQKLNWAGFTVRTRRTHVLYGMRMLYAHQ